MPRRSQVSQRQNEIIIEFAETHQDLVLNRCTGGPMGSQATRRAWQDLALKLNAIGDGVQKTWVQWRRYWVDWKARIRAKAADSRRAMGGTGGGPNRLEPLNPLEERLLALIGSVAVEGLPEVRIPLAESSTESPSILGVQVSGGTPIAAVIDVPLETQPNIMEPVPVQALEIVELQAPLSPVHVLEPAVPEEHRATPPTADTAALEPGTTQNIATGTNRRTRRRTQRRQNVRFSEDPNAPRWAYDLENRRLENEQRTAAALENLARQLAEVVVMLNKIAVAIENK